MAETMNGTSNSGSTGGGNGLVGGAQGVQGARAGQGGAARNARNARNARKVRTGLVVSDKMQKTVVVAIERRVPHPVYGKMVTRTKRVKAHDEENTAKTGDTVRIMETRPLSKDKRWRVVEVVERAR
jgi:small subunit ribosomal protein S17